MRGKIIRAAFRGDRYCSTSPVWQYDYGQELHISGLALPEVFEVHFGNTPEAGFTKTQIGGDGVVSIPDEYLTTGLPIYAFIYLHSGDADGETEYCITIPVNKRPKPSDQEPTPVQQDAITEAIAALNAAVEQTEEDKTAAQASAEDAEAWAVGERNSKVVDPLDETYRNNAKYYAGLAEQALQESGYITGALNNDGELVIEVVGITGIDVAVQNDEVVVIYE